MPQDLLLSPAIPVRAQLAGFAAMFASDQFDAVIHIDETRALEPLEPWAIHDADLPETYPSAL